MTFRNLIEDIENVTVTELNGITGNPASTMFVQANMNGEFSLVASAGGTDPVPIAFGDTFPNTATSGDLFFYTGGEDDADGAAPRLFVFYLDDNSIGSWIAVSPTPELPTPPATAGTYSIVRNDDGTLEWAVVESGDTGGGGGGGVPTSYTSTIITDGQLQITLTPGLWRLSTRSTTYSGSAAISTTSGFSNITGGWYNWVDRGDVDNNSTRYGYGVYNSGASRFDVYLHGADGNNNTTLVWDTDRVIGTTSSNNQWMCGSNANNPFIATGGRMDGEFVIVGGDVEFTIIAGAFPGSGIQSATSGNIVFTVNKIE